MIIILEYFFSLVVFPILIVILIVQSRRLKFALGAIIGLVASVVTIYLIYIYHGWTYAIVATIIACDITLSYTVTLLIESYRELSTKLSYQLAVLISSLFGGTGVGLSTGIAAGVLSVFGVGFGVAMGEAPAGHEYVWPGNSIGSRYSVLVPIYVFLAGGALFGLAVTVNVIASQPFIRIIMKRFERGNVWTTCYVLINVCAFISGAIVFLAFGAPGLLHWPT